MVNARKLKAAYQTVQEMLIDRKYKMKVSKYTEEEVLEMYNLTNLKLEAEHVDGRKILILFYYHGTMSKIGVDCIKTLNEKYVFQEDEEKKEEEESGEKYTPYTNIMFVLEGKLTHHAEKEVRNIKGVDSEIFSTDNLYFNIMKHKYQPSFRIISASEKKKFLDKFKNKIPLIKITDKVSRYYNAKIGDIFEIIRSDDSIYYRIVIP